MDLKSVKARIFFSSIVIVIITIIMMNLSLWIYLPLLTLISIFVTALLIKTESIKNTILAGIFFCLLSYIFLFAYVWIDTLIEIQSYPEVNFEGAPLIFSFIFFIGIFYFVGGVAGISISYFIRRFIGKKKDLLH